MKKIINGKLYDTETAKQVGTWSNNLSYRDFNNMSESLYRKRTGEFFLYGEGGPMTKYAQSTGQNSWSGGEMIIPLTIAAAREWAEQHLTADEYAEIFGMPDEDDGERTTLCINLPANLAAKIRDNATEAGKSMSAYLAQVLGRELYK